MAKLRAYLFRDRNLDADVKDALAALDPTARIDETRLIAVARIKDDAIDLMEAALRDVRGGRMRRVQGIHVQALEKANPYTDGIPTDEPGVYVRDTATSYLIDKEDVHSPIARIEPGGSLTVIGSRYALNIVHRFKGAKGFYVSDHVVPAGGTGPLDAMPAMQDVIRKYGRSGVAYALQCIDKEAQ